jgi:hypothetical protein
MTLEQLRAFVAVERDPEKCEAVFRRSRDQQRRPQNDYSTEYVLR